MIYISRINGSGLDQTVDAMPGLRAIIPDAGRR
jgi:hypothetical protein